MRILATISLFVCIVAVVVSLFFDDTRALTLTIAASATAISMGLIYCCYCGRVIE